MGLNNMITWDDLAIDVIEQSNLDYIDWFECLHLIHDFLLYLFSKVGEEASSPPGEIFDFPISKEWMNKVHKNSSGVKVIMFPSSQSFEPKNTK